MPKLLTPPLSSIISLTVFPLATTVYDELVLGKDSSLYKDSTEKFTYMYEKYNKEVYYYCTLRVANTDIAVDIVQETFNRVWQYLQKGNSILNDKSFLYTIARHLIIDEYRKKKCVSLDLLIDTELEPTITAKDEIYLQADISHAMKCINQLPASYSSVLLMRYINDYSITQIAEELGISENVVSVRIYRGLCKLRALVIF